ncbi:hypothetical protein [Bartonella grahamii]|uniref:hypothetical protein n=1 Tax=Bartonella grahamii TaxID=33045 RepID=UPI0004B06552|nr:hypothetical protein [Bartonella grahamii]
MFFVTLGFFGRGMWCEDWGKSFREWRGSLEEEGCSVVKCVTGEKRGNGGG